MPAIWTVGHSTRTMEHFLELLTAHSIQILADVRRFPGSRKFPHFGQESLRDSLSIAGIEYFHFPDLGGRRKPRPDSHNTAWRNESFRGYADYMETSEFHAGFQRLLELAARKPTAVMCSESVWWRCHRALIADLLKAHEIEVRHIVDATRTELHPLTSAATLIEGKLSYSAG